MWPVGDYSGRIAPTASEAFPRSKYKLLYLMANLG